ncbi:hypothetical protein P7K49_038415, partial [Saguinus oedipus]
MSWRPAKAQPQQRGVTGVRNTLYPNASPKRWRLRVRGWSRSASIQIYKMEMALVPDTAALEHTGHQKMPK